MSKRLQSIAHVIRCRATGCVFLRLQSVSCNPNFGTRISLSQWGCIKSVFSSLCDLARDRYAICLLY